MQGSVYDDEEEHAIDKCPYTPCYIVPYGGGDGFVFAKMLLQDL